MTRFAFVSLALLLPAVASAAEPGAKAVAQDILTKGAALFDTRDAPAMAATYTEEAELSIISKDKDSGRYKTEHVQGRTAVERYYQDLFKDRKPETTSKNAVEFATYAGTDVMIVQGRFTLDVAQGGAYPFVQTRVKEGDRWLIMNIQVYIVD